MADQRYTGDDPAAPVIADDRGRGTAGDETAADQADASARPAADQPLGAEALAKEADAALEALQREKDELKDRLLRTAADFQNYRNRVDRERRELIESAASDVLVELLPIVDNVERALQVPAPAEADAFRKGIELIHKQMLDLLRKRGVTPIEALGEDFDPRYHQAVIHEASDEHREGEVMQELQRGYMRGDRLLRPAMVKVAKRP
jgi:molecular chaperone GrpE